MEEREQIRGPLTDNIRDTACTAGVAAGKRRGIEPAHKGTKKWWWGVGSR